MRIVSHTCSNTEIVCALGAGAELVGVDEHSDFPADELQGVARIGPDLGVDVDRVVALKPDIVLTSLTVPGHELIVDALQAAGLPILVLDPTSLAEVPEDIRRIGRAIGRCDAAERLAGELNDAFAAPPRPGPTPSILVEWWPKPVIAPGGQSWVTQLIELAGGRNPLADRDAKSVPLEEAEAAALRPDASVISWCGVQAEKYRPDVVRRRVSWQQTPAVEHGRIHCVSEALLGRPGPRLVEGLAALRSVVVDCA